MWKGATGASSHTEEWGMPRLALRRRLRFGRAVARLGSVHPPGRCQGTAWTCLWVSLFRGEGDVKTCQEA